jgi:hypothetical protein
MSRCHKTVAPFGTTAIVKFDKKMIIEPRPIAKLPRMPVAKGQGSRPVC